jgi:HAE1 family hydrophobic/amphiphilic exporter-1
MGLTEFCLKKPVLTGVAVLFFLIAGVWSLVSIPIQLTPDVEKPQATVRTYWPGASPYEVEREIISRQEEHLDNLPNLVRMTSQSLSGRGDITLEFDIGTNMDALLPRIANELDQVPSYPENALKPTIILSGANSSPIVWSQLRALPGNPRHIRTYKLWAEDVIKPELERIAGVSESRVYGGRDAQVQVRFDPDKLALYGISINQLIARIRAESVDISAGFLSQGKREYTVRTLSRFRTPEQLGNMIIKSDVTGAVYLRDVAEVGIGYDSQGSSVRGNEGPALVIPVYREAGSNVLELTQNVQATIERLNRTVLKDEGLEMKVLADPSYYINSSIDLVLSNIYLGGLLAILALYIFLGSLRSSLVVALSIPISLIGTFVFLKMFGRNINVISLAGLAFAVGMVMDAAIVVLENIDTWRKQGHSRFDSLVRATKEVYGAILASALTTVAVFLPVVFVSDEAGQLFKDIALAIVFAIMLSFAVSTTVIPPLYRVLFDSALLRREHEPPPNLVVRWLKALGNRLVGFAVALVSWLQLRVYRKLGVVVGLTAAAVVLGYALTPKLEYLPGGNRNLLISLLFPPPGYSREELDKLGNQVVDKVQPAIDGKMEGVPQIDRMFFVNFGTTTVMGAVAQDPPRVQELIPLMNSVIASLPGVRGFTSQTSLFEHGLGAGRSIDLEIYGDDTNATAGVAQSLFLTIPKLMPGVQIRPIPSFELANPEIRIVPNEVRAAAAGLSTQDLGIALDIYTDGRKIHEFTLASGTTLDLVLMSGQEHLQGVEDFEHKLLLAPNGRRVTVGSVADVIETVGPNEIDHITGKRAFMLRVLPPNTIALETALEILEQQVIAPANEEFKNVAGLHFALSGTADAFTKTRHSLQTGFYVAIGITFLLLVILFEDLLSPFVIMAALPVAGAGGLIALWLINHLVAEQPLDMLTMLGFLMMIGIVVNNPILIVSRALSLIREEGWPQATAVAEAVRSRLRPIFMTTTTSVFGLMPLVLKPGAGSELYRGLGGAVLGALVLSTLVNILFVPCLFSLFQDVMGLFRSRAPVDEAAVPQGETHSGVGREPQPTLGGGNDD